MLSPIAAIETSVLYRLGQMLAGDALRGREIGDGAGDFQYAVVRAGRETHTPDRHLKGTFARIVQRAERAELLRGDLGVVKAAALLDGSSAQDSFAHLIRRDAVLVRTELFI